MSIFYEHNITNKINSQGFNPTGSVILVTPDLANEWLLHNDNNPRKKISAPHVKAYAADMKSGKWSMNCEPIVFDANGNLKNGQHRLMAVIQSGVSVPMFVIKGIDPSVNMFDHGRSRRVSQELNCDKCVETLAKCIVSNAYKIGQPPVGIVKDYMLEHIDLIRNAINLSCSGGNKSIGKKRDVFVAIYLMLRSGENPRDIEKFMRVVNTQFMLDDRESSSAIVFYKYMLKCDKLFSFKSMCLQNIEIFLYAYSDFINGVQRRKMYNIKNTDNACGFLSAIRKKDGLEE